MAGEVDIEFEDQNPTLVEVLVDNTITEVQVIVQEPDEVPVVEVHVDPSASQIAIDAAAAAQAILDAINEIVGGGSVQYGHYTIYKAAANNNPANRLVIENGDTIVGLWSGDAFDDTPNFVVNQGSYIRAIYNGGGLTNLANFTIKQAD